MTKILFILAFILLSISCADSIPQREKEIKPTDSLVKNNAVQQLTEYIFDSIKTIRALDWALNFSKKQALNQDFSFHSDSLEINYGYIFSKNVRHLIIKRDFPWAFYTDIYKYQNSNFMQVHSSHTDRNAYWGDTIYDVNGDYKPDYLTHWYPMSGCCTRDVVEVYLQKTNGDFSTEFEFINPAFSVKEKIIRGLCYGYFAPYYKYKWNSYNPVDTIEYIYPPTDSTILYIKRRHYNELEKGQMLRDLPKEYENMSYAY